jgi:CBS domain containing-hemolysin-like protein
MELWVSSSTAQTVGFLASFTLITSLFILFSDLFPKRLGMAGLSGWRCAWCSPWHGAWRCCARWSGSTAGGPMLLFRLLGLSSLRDDRITSDDILAMMEAGARAGVLAAREQQVITNVFELDTRTVSSAMSPRDRVAFFLRDEPDSVIRLRIAAEPFSTYPVCEGDIDHVVGYVDAKDLFQRVLNNQPISLGTTAWCARCSSCPTGSRCRRCWSSSGRCTRTSPSSSMNTAWWWAWSR